MARDFFQLVFWKNHADVYPNLAMLVHVYQSINQSEKDYSDQSNECYCETTITVLINKESLK